MTSIYRFFIPIILFLHGFFTLYLFVDMFSDYTDWTLYHWRPFFMLFYTLTWLLIHFRIKWAIGFYLLLTMFDAACKYVYGNTIWGEALEFTLFPLSMVFLAVLILMYKSHFHVEKQS